MGFIPEMEDIADDRIRSGAGREAGCARFPANRTEFEEMNACPYKGKQKQKSCVVHFLFLTKHRIDTPDLVWCLYRKMRRDNKFNGIRDNDRRFFFLPKFRYLFTSYTIRLPEDQNCSLSPSSSMVFYV